MMLKALPTTASGHPIAGAALVHKGCHTTRPERSRARRDGGDKRVFEWADAPRARVRPCQTRLRRRVRRRDACPVSLEANFLASPPWPIFFQLEVSTNANALPIDLTSVPPSLKQKNDLPRTARSHDKC